MAFCLSASIGHGRYRQADLNDLVLEIRTEKRVGIEPSEILDDVSGVTIPMRHSSIGFDSVHQCTSRVLHSQCYTISVKKNEEDGGERRTVAMIVVHLGKHVHGVRIECKIRTIHNTQSIQLMTERSLPKDKLCSIRPVKAIDTVRSTNPILKRDGISPWHHRCVATTKNETLRQFSSNVFSVARRTYSDSNSLRR